MKKRRKAKSMIPGFGLSMGITITMLSVLILIPLASIFGYAFKQSPAEFFACLGKRNVLRALSTSLICSAIAALINCIFGLIIAWVLVRYEFPGKKLMDGIIELPFALPTAVAGITLSKLYSTKGLIGGPLNALGEWLAAGAFGDWYTKVTGEVFEIKISYTKIGLVIALIFVGIPFVVRAIQPVLEKLDPQFEEAAFMLGSSPRRTFFRVILPELTPALLSGFGLALARGIGEYGSVIYISGNSEKNGTQVVSYVIMQKLNSADYTGATTVAFVMLVISFLLLLIINMIGIHQAKRTKE